MARPYLQGSLTRVLIAGLLLVVGIVGCGDGGTGKHHPGGGGGITPTSFGVKQLGTSADDIGHSVATDPSGNIFVTGETQGNLFGTNAGGRDIFLVKFKSDGTQDWTKQFGTAADDIGHGVATDKDGNIFVTGETLGDLAGTGTFGGRDIFLVKFKSDGTQDWIQQVGTIADDIGRAVATDISGNIFVTGDTLGDLGKISAGNSDIFLAKFNSAGVLQPVNLLGTTADDIGRAVATDISGNIFVTGDTLGGLFGTNAGNPDFFLAKFNSSGVWQGISQVGTIGDDIGRGVATDSSGNILATGETLGSLFQTNAGLRDIFLVKYDTSGNIIWATQRGTIADDIGHGAATNPGGNIFVTGETQGNLEGNKNVGLRDIFLMKFNSAGVLQ